MPAGRLSRNTVLAGVFVLLFVGMFVLAIVLLNKRGAWLAGTNSYTIHFDLEEGAEGLEKGSPVKLGGKRVGSVSSVEFDPKPGGDADVTGIAVGIEVDKSIRLYSDAKVTLVKPLLGSNSALNIVKLNGGKGATPVPSGGNIEGELAPPAFISQSDYATVQEMLKKVARTVDVAESWVQDVNKDWPKPYDDIKATIASAKNITADVEKVTSSAQTSWEGWRKDIDDIFKLVRERADSITKGADAGIQDFQKFIADGRKLVADNREKIDSTIDSVWSMITKFQKEDYAEVSATIKRARETMEYVENIARNADQTLATKLPEIKEIITDASLAAQQLKLTMVEVRAAPWRLLYQPNKKELENELLYNTVRAYSESLGEVRAAADALEAATRSVAATPPGIHPAIDQSTLDALTLKLKDSLSKSAEQERLFYDRWIREDRK